MFRKPIRIKSNSQVKGCDRKNIRENLLQSFSNLTESNIENVLSKKEIINSIKLITSNNEIVQVYTIQKRPIVFEIRGRIFPTIYFLWQFPDVLPAFTTNPQVLSFLTSGADLMLPGVLTPLTQSELTKYENLQEGAIAYVNFTSNKAAVAVGVLAQSFSNMLASGGKGKCLIIYHVIGDKLCSLESIPNIPVADLGPPEWLKFSSNDEDFPELGSSQHSIDNERKLTEEFQEDAELSEFKEDYQEISSTTCSTEEMDKLLNYCFFVAIKYSKTLALPILTSNFYKLQMIPVCPEGKSLDLKKSSFKKLKTFLDSTCKDGIIIVKEVKKGVESITAINKDHPRFTEFYIEPTFRPKKEDKETNIPSTSITESYIITPNVMPIFSDTGFNKGDIIQMTEIRRKVTEYVKKYNCQLEENKRLVRPKEALIKICKTENCITWEELLEKVCECMKSCYKVTSGSEEVVNKGKVPPIIITVSQRSGNKKVTLIDNLELFGIKIFEFAKECQHGVGASTSISRPPGKKCEQLLIQGNQVLFVYNLLTEKYKIPQKYMRGLENAPKKRK